MKQISWNKKQITMTLLIGGILLGAMLIGVIMTNPRLASAQQTQLTPDEAKAAAEAESPGATATAVELEQENGRDVYEVQLDNGMEVEIDAGTGEILEIELEDDDEASQDGSDSALEVDND